VRGAAGTCIRAMRSAWSAAAGLRAPRRAPTETSESDSSAWAVRPMLPRAAVLPPTTEGAPGATGCAGGGPKPMGSPMGSVMGHPAIAIGFMGCSPPWIIPVACGSTINAGIS